MGIYTGVLLGAVQARPFWNTNLVAQMFLFSALSTGCALLLVILSLGRQSLKDSQIRFLYTLDICFITLELFIVLPYLIHGKLSVKTVQESLQLIMGGPYTVAFWFFFLCLGILVPLAVEVWEIVPAVRAKLPLKHNKRLTAATALLVLFGGYMLRYIFVYAGQLSSFDQKTRSLPYRSFPLLWSASATFFNPMPSSVSLFGQPLAPSQPSNS